MSTIKSIPAAVLMIAVLWTAICREVQADAYETYILTSRDFQRVRQDKDWALKAWPSWTYMPWSYQWTIGYTDQSGRWSLEQGYNGAFIDHGQTLIDGVDKLDWINKHGLRFYVDHTAGKGDLHLWDGNAVAGHYDALHAPGIRTRPVNAKMAAKLKALIKENINQVKSSPCRAAYALDDELSWGHFVHPTMWCVTDDRAAYDTWLKEIYGPDSVPPHEGWISYDQILPKLPQWSIGQFDCSQLMDQWTFNDSYWNNFIGELVEYGNTIDPNTPVGYVGGQSPNAFGGYDYAKLMRKVQFLEAYNIGGSQAIVRSFNPDNALPVVTTHFHKNVADTIWQTWYYLAHGNRGFIGWVENWFDGTKPRDWHQAVSPHYLEASAKIGPLMQGAKWIDDGVAIYYSHASIQLGWILDSEVHGRTWRNRNNDARLAGSYLVRHAWENMLRDEGLQYNFISYADVVEKGIPDRYKVLILPAVLCLSDVEAARIRDFCRNGGTVIADYLPGLWDQHGRGRSTGGVLDDMFGLRHDPAMKAGDIFQTRLWAETDQDANYEYKTFRDLLTNANTCLTDDCGFNRAVRTMPVNHTNPFGKGRAVLMNLSPQWYNAYRTESPELAAKRSVFMAPLKAAGLTRWVEISGPDTFGYEITYWQIPGRTLVFVGYNPELEVSMLGGGHATSLKTGESAITLRFDRPVNDVRNERTGRKLGSGTEFPLLWRMNEALVISFEGPSSGTARHTSNESNLQ